MYITGVRLKDFRCFEEARYSFSPHFNLIIGPNARGKTSILEAIGYLITGRSFRTSKNSDLVRHGADSFTIEASFVKYGIEQVVKVTSNGRQRKVVYNGSESRSATHLVGLIHGVAVVPDDIALVKGGPAPRRDFIDLQIAQTDPLYVHHLMRYHGALQQRNALLRTKNLHTIDVWEQEMSHAAAYLLVQRRRTLEALNIHAKAYYTTLSAEQAAMGLHPKGSICYSSTTPKDEYLQLFQRLRQQEMRVGFSLSGPHRDDIRIALGGQDARFFASEGQQRSCIAALRLAEWRRLADTTEVAPLMLVDDLCISLDAQRRGRFMEHLAHLGQVFLTTTDKLEILLEAERKHVISLL